MNTSSHHRGRAIFAAALAALSLTALSGCKSSGRAGASRAGNTGTGKGLIVLDGKFTDWPAGAATMADADWVYFAVAVEGQTMPLQASDTTLALWLDADDNPGTGVQMPAPAIAAALGVDLAVEFSPQDGSGHATPGVAVYAYGEKGAKVGLNQAQLELAAAPTTAAAAYEIRISRHPDAAVAPVLAKLLSNAGRARGMFVLIEKGKVVGSSNPESFALPPLGAGSKPVSESDLPQKPAGSIRVLSYNVLKNSPEKNGNPFSRIFEATKPDIILLQEWDTNQATAQAWFTAMVTGESRWSAVIGEGGDVLIVSPHPISPLTHGAVTAAGAEKPVRFASARVKTPAGEVAVATVHLKCCGTVGSSEDTKRIAEATAVQAALSSAYGTDGSALRLVTGDMNLVGSTTPLEKIAAGLDFDGSPLAAANPLVLGDSAEYTWSDEKEKFPPGRLDYILYSDSKATVLNSFVLDTRRLTDRSLARMGLARTDSAASDHLPVVVDFKVK